MVWTVEREATEDDPEPDPIVLHLGECIVLLNRVGITLREARSERDPLEVEALLMDQLATAELRREQLEADETVMIDEREPINPGGDEPAPDWVQGLPEGDE